MSDSQAQARYQADRPPLRRTLTVNEYLELPIYGRESLSVQWCRYRSNFDGADRSDIVISEIIEACTIVFTERKYDDQRAEMTRQLRRLLDILRGSAGIEYFNDKDLAAFDRIYEATSKFTTVQLES